MCVEKVVVTLYIVLFYKLCCVRFRCGECVCKWYFFSTENLIISCKYMRILEATVFILYISRVRKKNIEIIIHAPASQHDYLTDLHDLASQRV